VGDVKLAPTLGLALGWRSWGTVAVGVAGFLLGGLAGLGGMLALGLSRKSRLPFGPWLVVGALLGVLVGGEVAGWFRPPRSAPGRPGQVPRTMMRPSMPV
jgi:leader peptidase (prepilin peptidase)/N-methyltransferase